MSESIYKDHFIHRSLKIERGWLRSAQAAEYIGVSPNNLRNMIYRGYLSPIKFAGRWYFKKTELDSLIQVKGTIYGY